MFTAFLIKYAEIGIKGKNRYLFEDALVQQIKYALKKCEGEFKIHKTQGRIFVDALTEFDFDETVENLILNHDVEIFLFGSKSEFNSLCRDVVTELKGKHPHIKRVYVRAEYEEISEDYENRE